MFAAFAINISTASVTASSLVCLAPKEIGIGWNLIDGGGHSPGCPSREWAGPGTTDSVVPGDTDLERKKGKSHLKYISLVYSLNL